VQEFQTHFIKILANLKELDDGLFEEYISENSKFKIEAVKSEETFNVENNKFEEFIETYDITSQIKERDFGLKNASYVFKLDFSLEDTNLLKEKLRTLRSLKVIAEDISLVSGSYNYKTCRSWNIEISYELEELDEVKVDFEHTYKLCNADISRKDDSGIEIPTIIFKDIMIYNFFCLILNVAMSINLITVVIDTVRYQFLEREKENKYQWLLRKNKNFTGTKALKDIFQREDKSLSVSAFNFWTIMMLLTNMFQLLANLTIFMGDFLTTDKSGEIDGYISLFLGIGCFFAWLSNLRILSFYEELNVVNDFFVYGVPKVAYFAVGIAPIFLAFVYSGYCMFHEAETMSELENSFLSFLALFAADELQNFFFAIEEFPLSYTWAYTYCVTFLFFIANVFVALVEGSFDQAVDDLEEKKK